MLEEETYQEKLDAELKIPEHTIEIMDLIEKEFEFRVLDRRSKEYKYWRIKMNELITECNSRVGFKCYGILK